MKFDLIIALLVLTIVIVWYLQIMISYFKIHACPVDVDLDVIVDAINSRNSTLTDVYYINLAKSVDRKNEFLSKLDDTINPIRVEAVTPETLPKIIKPLKCFKVTQTEYACTTSHLKAIHTAYHDNQPWAIIAEDDAIIKNNIDWRKLMKTAPKDWELLQIHTCCIAKSDYNDNYFKTHFKDKTNLWVKTDHLIASAAFYIINRPAMEKLLSQYVVGYRNNNWENIKMLDLTPSGTLCVADYLLFNGIKRYICTYPLIEIAETESTIHWSHTYNDYSHNL